MDVAAEQLPMALAELHRALARGAALHMGVTAKSTSRLREVVERAGFVIEGTTGEREEWIDVEATRARRLPDTVGASMRVLVVGLNPSIYSADAGVGFARPGNRFWPAATAAELVSRPLDPFRALRIDRIGMTNIVARATRRADELSRDEYTAGVIQLERLVAWLRPDAVCFVGVTGYRIAVDKRAQLGWQPDAFAGVPAYVMPNTSGLNAHAKPADFVDHLRAVQRVPT
jgi:TDG/mug DNA glycosylase family protein